jgi:AbrB family looped-hinge helix DNA binding protein
MESIEETIERCFYGSATLGERGQVVIPAEALKDCDIHAGDKLLVFRHPKHSKMLILAKVGEMQQFLQQVSRAVEVASAHLAEEEVPGE